MTESVLIDPAAPLASARRLVADAIRAHALPPALVEPVTHALGVWLGKHPSCQRPAGRPDSRWSAAAARAHRDGVTCEAFRRVKRVTAEADNDLKWIALAASYAGESARKQAHLDPAVRGEAQKLVRGLATRRVDWLQTEEGLKRVRSLVQKRGKDRAVLKPVRDALVLSLPDGLRWREVVTVQELAEIGRRHRLCTRERAYALRLRNGLARFFALETASGTFLGLASLHRRAGSVEQVRGPGNESLFQHRTAVSALLDAFETTARGSEDLLGLGLTDAVPQADLDAPDLVIGEVSCWFGTGSDGTDLDDLDEEDEGQAALRTSILVRLGQSFCLLRSLSEDRYTLKQGHGAEYDSDDLLARTLLTLRDKVSLSGHRLT